MRSAKTIPRLYCLCTQCWHGQAGRQTRPRYRFPYDCCFQRERAKCKIIKASLSLWKYASKKLQLIMESNRTWASFLCLDRNLPTVRGFHWGASCPVTHARQSRKVKQWKKKSGKKVKSATRKKSLKSETTLHKSSDLEAKFYRLTRNLTRTFQLNVEKSCETRATLFISLSLNKAVNLDSGICYGFVFYSNMEPLSYLNPEQLLLFTTISLEAPLARSINIVEKGFLSYSCLFPFDSTCWPLLTQGVTRR